MSGNKDSRYGDKEMKLKSMRQANNPDGVAVDPIPVTSGDEVTVLYYGTMSDRANQMFLHCGYGKSDSWQKVTDMRMERTDRGWVKNLQLSDPSRLNFCFRDENNNWDNNKGLDWSVEIHRGDLP
ncbi:carbohydrate-binding protein [Metallumcola ferriviriculae]|uniref:Carbohydrate-binding protein n=1 Tax=Metallumcola ferriviriculae TaxID=3039180 RepID=A0AAU0UT61_9FIRM|nr:carbohydrate-binding protein [Desulfitibacteraceae bacterium MK1]